MKIVEFIENKTIIWLLVALLWLEIRSFVSSMKNRGKRIVEETTTNRIYSSLGKIIATILLVLSIFISYKKPLQHHGVEISIIVYFWCISFLIHVVISFFLIVIRGGHWKKEDCVDDQSLDLLPYIQVLRSFNNTVFLFTGVFVSLLMIDSIFSIGRYLEK